MYKPYVTVSEYGLCGDNKIDAEDVYKYLVKASRHVDALTFNRILRFGWDRLTDFQQGCIQGVVIDQAEFLYENRDAIDSMLNSYSINGVSMTFGDGCNIRIEGGLPMREATYKLLEQTGLCCRLAR